LNPPRFGVAGVSFGEVANILLMVVASNGRPDAALKPS
jgi:hypothetical protein